MFARNVAVALALGALASSFLMLAIQPREIAGDCPLPEVDGGSFRLEKLEVGGVQVDFEEAEANVKWTSEEALSWYVGTDWCGFTEENLK